MWNYAFLSMEAKAAGGPEQLINTIYDSGIVAGRNSMIPAVAGAFLGGVVAMALIGKVRSYLKERNTISKIVVEQARRELVQEIQKYEESQCRANDSSNPMGFVAPGCLDTKS